MRFIRGYFGAYLTVIIVLFVNNCLLISYSTFYERVNNFLSDVPSLLIFGHYYIIPGCLLGEILFRKYVQTTNFFTGMILFGALGFIYGAIITGFQSDSELFLVSSIVGSIMFFLFRGEFFQKGLRRIVPFS